MVQPPAVRQEVAVGMGQAGLPLGTLVYARQGRREHCAFAYDTAWLHSAARFSVSADLQLVPGYQAHKAASAHDSVFHGAMADTAPDAWGRRVIARDHAKRRRSNPQLPALTELDYLLAVDDFSRVGALRLGSADGAWQRTVAQGQRSTPPLIELERVFQASRAVERGQETTEDLRYLQGKGTSLGGMRPKCTLVDEDGRLAIGKFPSVQDARSVTRGEVLALRLAALAGIDTAPARVVLLGAGSEQVPVAVIGRFDRDGEGGAFPTSRRLLCYRLHASRNAAIPRLPMPFALTAMRPLTMCASFGGGCCSTCSSPMWMTICKTTVFCMWRMGSGGWHRRLT